MPSIRSEVGSCSGLGLVWLLPLALLACGDDGERALIAADAGGGDAAPMDHGHFHEHPPDAGSLEPPPQPDLSDFDWRLPAGFPPPKVPEDNPMSEAKVALGRHLFYDKRLSGNGTQSCASCHEQSLAFTDGRAVGLGSTGEAHVRGAMSLVNVAYAPALTWANPVVRSLERQALVPLFGEDPVELGLVAMEDELLARLRAEPRYGQLFAAAFPEDDGMPNIEAITKALAAFQRTIIAADSPYDRYEAGDREALSEPALRGMKIFFSEDAECFHCHGGFTFTDSVTHQGKAFDEMAFHNTSLYNLPGGYPAGNEGIYNFSGDETDIGRFKAPSLRNIALTAPYMHDGSIATLSEVIDHYAAGGRSVAEGAGVNPNRSEFVTGFPISEDEKRDLIAFLEALTDEGVLTEERWSDPW